MKHKYLKVLKITDVVKVFSDTGGISVNKRYKFGFDHNIGQADRHSEWPRPNG